MKQTTKFVFLIIIKKLDNLSNPQLDMKSMCTQLIDLKLIDLNLIDLKLIELQVI